MPEGPITCERILYNYYLSVSPNEGVQPDDSWCRIGLDEWKFRFAWGLEAEESSVYGSYDDTCDAIHLGMSDTKGFVSGIKACPNHDPFDYYKVVKELLTN